MSWRDQIRQWFARPAPPDAAPAPAARPLPALPSPEPSGASSTRAGEDVEALLEQLREAARGAGVQRDDPMMPLLNALAQTIRYLSVRIARSDQIADQASRRVVDALDQACATADAEAARFEAKLASTETQLVDRLGMSIAQAADRAFTRRVRVLQINSILVAAAILAGSNAASLFGGYRWGSGNARAGIHETEAGLQEAFSTGADDARTWLELMTWNNIGTALRTCSGSDHLFTDAGRKACNVPLWIEPPQPSDPSLP